jgi:lipopolysaccharide export system protein LptC
MSDVVAFPQADPDPDKSGASGGRVAALEAWRRRSQRIRFLRRALPAAMIALIVLLLGWIGVRAVLTALNEAHGATGRVHMTNARLHGRDGRDQAFVLTSKDAIRDEKDPNRIELTQPALEVASQDGQAPKKTKGDQGVYFSDRRILYMDGHVVFDNGQGSRFTSDHAVVDLQADTVTGNSAVHGDSPLGHIDASSYSVDQHGEHVVFIGNVRGHLVNRQEQAQ